MTIARQMAISGVAVIEHALTALDLARIAELVLGRTDRDQYAGIAPAETRWLQHHAELTALAAHIGGDVDDVLRLAHATVVEWPDDRRVLAPWSQDRALTLTDMTDQALARHVTLTVFAAACDAADGPLDVIPGSHTAGRLDKGSITALTAVTTPLLCLTAPGDILALRPLTVRRRQRPQLGRKQRVLVLDYAPSDIAPSVPPRLG
jgi:hypothetical protein